MRKKEALGILRRYAVNLDGSKLFSDEWWKVRAIRQLMDNWHRIPPAKLHELAKYLYRIKSGVERRDKKRFGAYPDLSFIWGEGHAKRLNEHGYPANLIPLQPGKSWACSSYPTGEHEFEVAVKRRGEPMNPAEKYSDLPDSLIQKWGTDIERCIHCGYTVAQ